MVFRVGYFTVGARMNMEKMKAELVRDEGLRLKPYMDTVGKLTVGIGRNLTDNGITEDEAFVMLQNDIANAENDLMIQLPLYNHLSEVRQRVLVNMCFNMGIGKLLTFKQTLGFISVERYNDAADSMLDSLWAKQVGVRAVRLADMMRTG